MIALFRAFLNTWAAKLFFMLLIGVFVVWGIGDVVRNAGNETAVATVGGRKIEMPEAQDAYRRQLAQVTRMLGTTIDPTPEIRRRVAAQALEGLITQAAMNVAVSDLGLMVPDAALRQAVFDLPAFRGPDGKFDRTQFTTLLRTNGFTEQRFLDLMRSEIGQRQLVGAVRAGSVSPDTLNKAVFAFEQEKRQADAVTLRFDAAAEPAPPTDEVLKRWYENHADLYSTPEYRRIKAVLLSPEGVAKDLTVDDGEVAAAYEARRASFTKPERRSVQVVLMQDEAKAKALADKWSAGADWAAIQQEATALGGAPVELPDATRGEIPAPELAEAIFAAKVGEVPPPVKSALGWHVLKVTALDAGGTETLETMGPALRNQLLAEKAADQIYDRSAKIEDMLAAGTKMDDLPGDLGLTALQGTLDINGMTPEGQPAPINANADLKRALIQAAFAAKKDELPRLVEAPKPQDAQASPGFYAVVVEDITKPAPKPIADVADAVRSDWRHDAVRRETDATAAKLLTAVQGGQSMEDAATVAGVPLVHLPAAGRASNTEGVPTQLLNPLFGLKPNEATMVETEDGFVVAQLKEVIAADPNADPIGFGKVRDALTQALGDDIQRSVTYALRLRAQPKVNTSLAERIAQPD
jgi:peptidyl-prolyl cis-trans isomerase D